jgi:hypothetical protein
VALLDSARNLDQCQSGVSEPLRRWEQCEYDSKGSALRDKRSPVHESGGDAVLALMHDEVEIEPRLGALDGDYRGHEGVRRWWSNLLDALPDYAAEIEELEAVGISRSDGSGVRHVASAAPCPSSRRGGS